VVAFVAWGLGPWFEKEAKDGDEVGPFRYVDIARISCAILRDQRHEWFVPHFSSCANLFFL